MVAAEVPPNLVAGIDFSDGARAALETARVMAERMNVDLLIVHVRDPGDSRQLSVESEQWLAESRVPRESLQCRFGRPWVELARAAAASGAFALVVGSHGLSGSQPVTLGSTTAKLGLLAPCPVIIVNQIGGPGRLPTPSP